MVPEMLVCFVFSDSGFFFSSMMAELFLISFFSSYC
jgi:hypothetical protein